MSDLSLDFRNTAGDAIDRLPMMAAEKLRAMRQERDDARMQSLAASDAWNEVHREKNELVRHLNSLTQFYGKDGKGIPALEMEGHDVPASTKNAFQIAEAKLVAAQEKLQRATDLRDARTARVNTISPIVDVCERYIALQLGVTFTDYPAPDIELKKTETITAAIERLRNSVATFGADLHAVRSAPWPSGPVKARLRAEIAALAETGKPDLFEAIETNGGIRWPEARHRTDIIADAITKDGPAPIAGVIHAIAPDNLRILAWLFPDAMAAAIDREVDAVSDDKHALSREQRQKRDAEIFTQKLEVERLEEALICLAQDQGTTIARRPQCDPRAILQIDGPRMRVEA